MLTSVAPHVKWFTDPRPHPTDWSLLLSLPVIVAIGMALGAAGVAFVIQHRVPEPRVMQTFERFARIAPTALGLHVGIALLAFAALGMLFSPNLRPTDEPLGRAILVVEAMCGLMLLVGLATRGAAVLLALLGIAAMQPFTFESILENVHFLGIAIFFFIVGRGPLSLDRLRGVLVIGIVIVSGQLTRPVMAIGAFIFTLTLPLFGWAEFLGHLPFYGIMFVLFMAPSADSRTVKRHLRPAA